MILRIGSGAGATTTVLVVLLVSAESPGDPDGDGAGAGDELCPSVPPCDCVPSVYLPVSTSSQASAKHKRTCLLLVARTPPTAPPTIVIRSTIHNTSPIKTFVCILHTLLPVLTGATVAMTSFSSPSCIRSLSSRPCPSDVMTEYFPS